MLLLVNFRSSYISKNVESEACLLSFCFWEEFYNLSRTRNEARNLPSQKMKSGRSNSLCGILSFPPIFSLFINVYNLDMLPKESYVFSVTLFVGKSNFEKHMQDLMA